MSIPLGLARVADDFSAAPMVSSAPMILVGLTGGVATGKSTVAKMFKQCGAAVIDADQLARRGRRAR